MSEFKTVDEAIEAVDGTVSLTVVEWDDGFTWSITVTTNKMTGDGTYEQLEHEWIEDDGAHKTFTEAAITACEVAMASLGDSDTGGQGR